ncbi:C-type lectin BML-1 [Amphibalanus amphitrite]|uniref:C-type lectin BML-1 n=1 Tax=Amphibalanus amphitrite TaxID=1232801 RepID=A0A6A4VEW5_AMPAM|nr:C-type lectin BML-1 [Amphibalanus amphitrite]
MWRWLCLTLLFFASSLRPSSAGACPSDDWRPFRDMCYWSSKFSTTWGEAAQFCAEQASGADLVSIHDLDMDAFIGEQLLNETEAWLGLHRAGEGEQWEWSDGSNYDFTMWYENDPDWMGGCAAINFALMGRWIGLGCEETFPFMCQIAVS